MNQRFQSEDIKRVSEQYAGNELYQAVNSIGLQLESELKEFGLCPEECFTEVLELLTSIADKGEDIVTELDNIWLRKFNEYKRFDRHVNDDEIRKAVGIVFGFCVLAVDSSRHPFYRYKLTEQLTTVIANHQFEGWSSTLESIYSVPLSDGWFDDFIDLEPEEENKIKLPKELDTERARKYFIIAIQKNYMEATDEGKFRWIGTDNKGKTAELAYFLGKVYNYTHTISGNAGENFPEESLNRLFNVTRLYSSLTQVYNAQKTQRWRSRIDALFED